ncbi:MAG: peptide chain release factor N(5)-glutamine methyltransferase [Xanthobacteraceae bacterium]
MDISLTGQTIETARRNLTAHLQGAAIETPDLDARLMIGAVTRLDLTGLITKAEQRLTALDAARLKDLARRRIGGEPVARLLGHKEFWGLDFQLSPATLVPRPDTETVVETALDILRSDGDTTRALRIADLGTGSGAILLALLHELPNATGLGTDISLTALQTARANATRLGLADRATFLASNFAAAIATPCDLIVSNPPYIRTGDIQTLSTEVREHDPHRALDGGDDGLDAYRVILGQAANLLASGGTLVLEIGQHQSDDVTRLAHTASLVPHGPPRADLGGVPRALAFRHLPR